MPVTIGDFLHTSIHSLKESGITTARLDVFILLEDALEVDRSLILAHPEKTLSEAQIAKLNNNIVQRKRHLPLAYIRGKAAFYGRYFSVNTHVLVPRPETETIISLLKELPLPPTPKIADIGTGSGCIGITCALEIPAADVYLYDIDTEALKVAADNASLHHASVHINQQDLLQGCRESFNVILANLPYVPTTQPINQAAAHEPVQAIFSGPDGLDHYRKFFLQIGGLPKPPGVIITESEPGQHTGLAQLAAALGYKQKKSEGFVQLFAL